MRTEQVTIKVGERVGELNWLYDFSSHDWNHSGAVNPDHNLNCMARLRTLWASFGLGQRWEATTDGGSPRCGWGKVLDIGMYDGWPHWKPVPSVLIASRLGASWHPYYSITDIRTGGQDGRAGNTDRASRS